LPSINACARSCAATLLPYGASTHSSNTLIHVLVQNQLI
jgi:hypothetical protein